MSIKKIQNMTVIFVLAFSSVSLAELLNSDYDKRHQALIRKQALISCGYHPDTRVEVQQTSSQVLPITVDNGITDVLYTTKVAFRVRIDQGVKDTYEVFVRTRYLDQFDHETNAWGEYILTEGPVCNLK